MQSTDQIIFKNKQWTHGKMYTKYIKNIKYSYASGIRTRCAQKYVQYFIQK